MSLIQLAKDLDAVVAVADAAQTALIGAQRKLDAAKLQLGQDITNARDTYNAAKIEVDVIKGKIRDALDGLHGSAI